MKVKCELNLQLKDEEYKKYAEDCLRVYEAISLKNGGSVWSSEWFAIVEVITHVGIYPNSRRIYRLNYLGQAFLRTLNNHENSSNN